MNVRKWYNMNEINWYHTFRFFFFLFYTLFIFFFYLILCVINIQLNAHFYIFFQITIYSYGSLADEMWWTIHGRRPGLNKVRQWEVNLDKFWKKRFYLLSKVTLAVSKVKHLPHLPPLRYGHAIYKRTNWASRKNIKYGLRVFFLLSFELVNCKHRSRIYARVYLFGWRSREIVAVLFESEFK